MRVAVDRCWRLSSFLLVRRPAELDLSWKALDRFEQLHPVGELWGRAMSIAIEAIGCEVNRTIEGVRS
jgi:hypothetical protein